MRPLRLVTAAYSIAHFAVDFGCACALQMPLGLLADSWGRGLGFACLEGVLVAAVTVVLLWRLKKAQKK